MIGTRLSAYEVLSELGSGGMGSVYLAECADETAGLDKGVRVALKVIHPNLLSQPGFFKRFLREAQIGQDVRHENVVRCFDCDATLVNGQQHNFLVMEYVEGQTLRELLVELDRVPEELCRHIGREVAKGLAAIHEAGVVHRDLKPENVLITEDHIVKVMDLGVARLSAEAIRLSQTGAFVGSLEYAAPEQFKTADGPPDGRADLHSLGVVLYELSTGQHPYRDEDASKVLRNILDVTPRMAGEVNPQLSPFMEEVIHKLIAKDREQRFAAASDLALVLEEGEKSEWWKERAKELRIQTKRPLRRIRIPRETALYGRDDDLAKLQGLFDKAKAGEGQVLLIEGEAGIGKTRLVDEFVGRLRQAGEDVNFVFGSYPPGGAATAAGAFSEAYREQFGADGLQDTLKDYLTPTPVLIPAFAALLRGETTPTGAEPLTKDSLQTVFVHATRGLAAERTTIVLIDDLHFAPEDGRALFSSLAMAVPGHRILLVGTMRPGVPEDWTANLTRLDHAEHRSLARLGPKDLFRMLKDSFRSDRLAQELGMQISLKCDGNPFFAFEIIRGLREGQFISQRPDGTWVTTKEIQDIQVPLSVLDLVNARVADLTEDERDLLDVAACCGFEFEPGLVAEVTGLARIPALKRIGQIERRHRLVRTAGRKCVFDHHQVQEALYGSLMPELREEYHAAIAEALATRAGAADTEPNDLDGSRCVDLCDHYLKGARGEKAIRYLDAALTHLENGFLNDQAIALTGRALDVPGLLVGAARAAVLLRKAGRLDLLGRREAQEEAIDEACALAETADAQAPLAKVESARGLLRLSTGRYEEAATHFEQCHAIAYESGDQRGEARATGNLGNVLWSQGRYEEARAQFEKGLALSWEIGDRQGEAVTTGNLGSVLFRQGWYEEARAQYEKHLALSREIGDRQGEAVALVNLGPIWLALGDRARARSALEESATICHEIGARDAEGYALLGLAAVAQEECDGDSALHLASRALALRREIGHSDGVADSLIQVGEFQWQAEAGDAGRAALNEAVDLLREQKRDGELAHALALLANLPEGDVEAAEAALKDAGDSGNTPQTRLYLWKATGRHGHLAEAKCLLDYRVEHAPEEYRESMLKNVRINREIMETWEEQETAS